MHVLLTQPELQVAVGVYCTPTSDKEETHNGQI